MPVIDFVRRHLTGGRLLMAALIVTALVYWPGLHGSWLFDDFPNIVDNKGVQPAGFGFVSLLNAALSSPASEFKRPLASLSFAANFLAAGLDPFAFKLTNVVIHLLNGALVFWLARALLRSTVKPWGFLQPGFLPVGAEAEAEAPIEGAGYFPIGARLRAMPLSSDAVGEIESRSIARERAPTEAESRFSGKIEGSPVFGTTAAEAERTAHAARDLPESRGPSPEVRPKSIARERAPTSETNPRLNDPWQLGIVAALIALAWLLLPINLTGVLYVVQRMESMANAFVLVGLMGYVVGRRRMRVGRRGLLLCVVSLMVPTAIGITAKETAVMLPLYAFLIEWALFRFARGGAHAGWDRRVVALFAFILFVPMLLGLIWIVPQVLGPNAFGTRDFNLVQRLLSEARIVADYIPWTLTPCPGDLSFYHDDFHISHGLLQPWTTLASIVILALLVAAVFKLRARAPLVSLGLALFLGGQLLTGTILPLELIYEHRNYFPSFGLLLALVPLLAAPAAWRADRPRAELAARIRYALLGVLLLGWTGLTAATAYDWGDDLRLAQTLAERAPNSPRAQYELGRAYIIYSKNDRFSPFTHLAYAPLERAAKLPDASILPEQALIFMNARMHLPIKQAWWNSMVTKLQAHPLGVQDDSSLQVLTRCAINGGCDLSKAQMTRAFDAAIAHPIADARTLAAYADYAWSVLDNRALGVHLIERAVKATPSEPAYRITLIRWLVAAGDMEQARKELPGLEQLNLGGRLDGSLAELRESVGVETP